ncbi:hypothetical protein N7467_011488 [Penicillium canescens]|nr:hypothetical protein N7467_011488 [Penicillium canescens]
MTDMAPPENPGGCLDPGTIPPTRTCTLNNRNRSDITVEYDRGATPWMTAFGSFCIIVATYGLLASNGVFLTYWNAHQLSNYSKEKVGWITGVHLFLTLFLGALTGTLFDVYGSKILLLVGSLLYLSGIFVLGECFEYWHFMLSYGVMSGIGCGVISTVAFSVVPHWFDKKRGIANGIIIMGGSFGGIVFPLVLRFMLEPLEWAWSIRTIGIFMSALVIAGNICVKSRKIGNTGFTMGLSGFRDSIIIYLMVGITGTFNFTLADNVSHY